MKEKLTVLVVDDNSDDRLLYQRELVNAFGNSGVEIAEAGSGEKGLEWIEKYSPDCVLLDYSLPGRNGLEVLKTIRASHPHLPVIMLTGQGNEDVAVKSMKEGAQDYITKAHITADSMKRLISMAIEHGELQKRVYEQQTALEIFTRALAHDLKEPMRTIRSFTEMILKNKQLPEKEERYFQYVQNASVRMTMLIDTVFFYTQMDGYKKVVKEQVDMNLILQETHENLARIIQESHAEITVEPLSVVCANRVQMLQVWQNLIANAIRHGGEGVRIHIGCKEQDGSWVFSVKDNGPGIEAKFLENIFQPFKRLSGAKEEGAGLGLAICRKIVGLHEGKIWCESEVGNGTTFLFTHPMSTPASPAIHKTSTEEVPIMQQATGKQLANVLLVDDRRSDIELVRIALVENAGLKCNMMVANGGNEALSILRSENAQENPVDLVLLDINMPGMDGFELLENMRKDETMKDIAVIMCTGSTYDKDKERAKSLGAIGYMVKPPLFEYMKPLLERVPTLQLSVEAEGYLLQRVH